MSVSATSFLLPDVEPSWKLWKSLTSPKAETLDTPAECRESSRQIIVGLPATNCRTVGILLPTADPNLLQPMMEAQMEKRGIVLEKLPAPNYAWHVLGQSGGHTFISVDVLASPFPADLAVKHAENYTSALRLMHLPASDLTLIEEHGLLVVAVSHQGKLWHSHIIGTAETSALDLARELEITKLSLESQEGFGLLRGLTLIGPRLAALAPDFQGLVSFPIETQTSLEPNRTLKLDTFQRLLPAAVHQAQNSKKKRKQLFTAALIVAGVYVLLFTLGWLYVTQLQNKQKTLSAEIAQTDEPASEIRATAQHWRALEPAIEPQRYPMVQLSQITTLMPPSGVQLKKFTAKPDEIELIGDARDAQTATQFFEDLKKHAKLSRFTWSMPVPSVKDKIASFKIQGKLQG